MVSQLGSLASVKTLCDQLGVDVKATYLGLALSSLPCVPEHWRNSDGWMDGWIDADAETKTVMNQ